MSGCDFEDIESLAYGELPPDRAAAALAHAAACPACAHELTLLRSERALFADRARATSALPGFSAALALSRWSGPPAIAAKPLHPAAQPRFPWALSSFGVAAAAACAGLFLLPPTRSTRIEAPAQAPIAAEPAPEDFCRDETFSSGITSPAKSPTTCEMPTRPAAPALPTAAETSECGSGAPEASPASAGIVTCGHDSFVTDACY